MDLLRRAAIKPTRSNLEASNGTERDNIGRKVIHVTTWIGKRADFMQTDASRYCNKGAADCNCPSVLGDADCQLTGQRDAKGTHPFHVLKSLCRI